MRSLGFLLLLQYLARTDTSQVPTSLYWNSSNPIFRSGEVVLEVNRDNLPWEYDQVNLICPTGPNSTEQHIVYSVSRREWQQCRLQTPKPRIVAICDQPGNFMYFTITFRSFSPSPQQMEFKPGQSYYFVSTAREDNLYSTEGGWCSSHNMRLIFRVAESESEVPPTVRGREGRPAVFWSKYWRSGIPGDRDLYNTREGDTHLQHLDPGSIQEEEEERGSALQLKSGASLLSNTAGIIATVIVILLSEL